MSVCELIYSSTPISHATPTPVLPSVFLYNCTSVALARDCSECVSLPPELDCGYCSSPAQCLHSTFCSAQNTFIGSQQDTGQCPVQFEVSRELTHSVSVLIASLTLLRSKLSSVCVTPHHISVTGFQHYTHVKHMSHVHETQQRTCKALDIALYCFIDYSYYTAYYTLGSKMYYIQVYTPLYTVHTHWWPC